MSGPLAHLARRTLRPTCACEGFLLIAVRTLRSSARRPPGSAGPTRRRAGDDEDDEKELAFELQKAPHKSPIGATKPEALRLLPGFASRVESKGVRKSVMRRGQGPADDDDCESEDEDESKPPKLMKPAATRRLVTRPKAAATEESVGFKVLETGARGALNKGLKQLQGLDDDEDDKQWGRQQRAPKRPRSATGVRENVFEVMARKQAEAASPSEASEPTTSRKQQKVSTRLYCVLRELFSEQGGLCPVKRRDGSPLIDITDVHLSMDLRHAVVWWTLAISTEPDMLAKVDPHKQQRAAAVRKELVRRVQEQLTKATKGLRHEVCMRVQLKRMPILEFKVDAMVEAEYTVRPLLEKVRAMTPIKYGGTKVTTEDEDKA